MPEFFQAHQRQIVGRGSVEKVRDVVHKSRNLNPLIVSLKPRYDATVLPKRMKLADEDSSAFGEHARGFTQDKPQTLDVFEYEIARDQID